jgi:hypothetical protein
MCIGEAYDLHCDQKGLTTLLNGDVVSQMLNSHDKWLCGTQESMEAVEHRKCTILARNLTLSCNLQPDITPAHLFQPTPTPHSVFLCIRKDFFKCIPMTYENNTQPMNITHLLPIQLDPEKFLQLLL